MLTLLDRPARLCDGITRRDWLRVGGLSCLGLSLPALLRGEARAAPPLAKGGLGGVATQPPSFGRARSCIILFLAGGPPQHETFDPKPDAPEEVRGPLEPISTSVPGVQIGELLPRIAAVAHRFSIIRSMTTGINAHASSGSWMLTGYPHPAGNMDIPASPRDWPSLGSVVGALKPSERFPFSAATLPERIVNNPGVPWPGQNGGFMGHAWDPQLFTCDPSAADFRIDSLVLPADVPPLRLSRRRDLLEQLEQHVAAVERARAQRTYDGMTQRAFDLLTSEAARAAFALDREPQAIRDRYGRHRFGQSVLLGRRLIEAGVRLVQVNFPREPGDLSSGNPLWDTHSDNAGRLRDALCPPFDAAFPALLDDLAQRRLLDETLVVVMGEFGRTPQINANGGRDHWGHCFSVALAGGGVRPGQVYGSSDRQGGYPMADPVAPQDLTATIFHLLGLDPDGEFHDPLSRPLRLSTGGVLHALL